jgi:hypothetical protein
MEKRTPYGISPDDTRRLREAPWKSLRPGVEVRDIQSNRYRVKERYYFFQNCSLVVPLDFVAIDDLWSRVYAEGGMICFPCFEKRLGREIKSTDLKPEVRVNLALLMLLCRLEEFTGDVVRPVDPRGARPE